MDQNTHKDLFRKGIADECSFKSTRSSGPGGQHVNKTNTKVELRFDLLNSEVLNREEKERIKEKVSGRITRDGIIVIVSQDSRSLKQNKENALHRLFELIEDALKVEKERRPTKPTKASIEKRLDDKRKTSLKKQQRKL